MSSGLKPEHRDFVLRQLAVFGQEEKIELAEWVSKTKREKEQNRLFIISSYHILTIKDGRTGLSVQRSAHIFQLKSCEVNEIEISLNLGDWSLRFGTTQERAQKVVSLLWDLTSEVKGQSVSNKLLAERIPPKALDPAASFVEVFKAFCACFSIVPSKLMLVAVSRFFTTDNHHLDFSKLEFDPASASTLFVVFMNCLVYDTWFRSVSVSNYLLIEDALTLLAVMLKDNSTVQSIRLHNVGATKALAVSLSEALTTNRTLMHLDLAGNALQDKGLQELCNAFKVHPLEVINIDGFRASPTGMTAFLQLVADSPEINRRLVELDLSNNRLGSRGSTELARWLFAASASTSKLRRLSVANCSLEVPTFLEGLRATKLNLTHLNLAGNPFTNDAGLMLSHILCLRETLVSLNISGTNLAGPVMEAIVASLTHNPARTYLLSAAQQKEAESAQAQAQAQAHAQPSSQPQVSSTSTLSIDISDNPIGEDAAIKIASLLAECGDIVSSLRANNVGLGFRGTTWLAHALTGHATLTELCIDRNVLQVEADQVRQQANSRRLPLDLDVAMARLVSGTPSLQVLSVAGDQSTGHAVPLAPMLVVLKDAKSSSLRRLDIRGNSLGISGALSLGHMLSGRPSLEAIFCDGNNFSASDFANVLTGVKANRTLLEFPFPESDMRKDVEHGHKKQIDQCRATLSDLLRRNWTLAAAAQQSLTAELVSQQEEKQ